MKSFRLKKVIAFILLLNMSWMQVSSSQDYQLTNQPAPLPVKEPLSNKTQGMTDPSIAQTPQTSEEFLRDTLTLTPVTNKEEISLQQINHYEYERYDFKDALDLLRPEYASAVIVKKVSSEDLRALGRLSFETGIIVLHGEIVLFTSGNQDEIGALPTVKELIKKASFVSHTHVDEFSEEGPSGQDLNFAGSSLEYVITGNGVYAYDHEGVAHNGEPYSYGYYLNQLNQALQNSKIKDEVQARAELNQFIKSQDLFNRAPAEEKQTLLMGGTLTFTSGLTSANVTTFTGSPYPYFMSGSSATTALSLGVDGRFQLNYDVTAAGSKSGMTISFDNASTTTVETQNLSALTNIIFGLQGSTGALKVEFVDINGNKDSYTLTNVSNASELFWQIATSTIVSTVDKTKIKQINLFVDQSTTTALTGTLFIRSKGLNTAIPSQPVVATTIPAGTPNSTFTLSGTKLANTAILINGLIVVPLNSSTSWTATVNLSVEGNNAFSITAKNSIGLISTVKSVTIRKDTIVPTGSININSSATYTNSTTVTLNLTGADSGSGINQMSFSTNNTTWSASEAFLASKSFIIPTGDGTKIVYVKFYDKAGNVSATYSKSIILDTVPPVFSLISATTSNLSNYTLIYTIDGTTKNESVTLQEGKNYIVRSSTDLAGNNATKTFQISLDAKPPVIQSLQINQGIQMTKNANVTLNLVAYDLGSQITEMSISNDGVNYSAPENFSMTKSWTLTDGRGQKTVWVKGKDASGLWSVPVSASIFYQKALMLDDFDGTNQVETYWDSNGSLPYQRIIAVGGAFEGTNAMQINFQKTSAFSYAYFALQPKQDGIANDFSTYRTLRLQLNKLHNAPMVLMAKLEFNGTSQTFETQVGIPQGTYGWQEAIFDFSTVSPTLLKNVKNILFFADPGSPSTQGSFTIDNIRIDEWPETKVIDDFEGNNIPLQTYWDANGSFIYQRSVTETNAYDGTHSMKVAYTKKPGYPYSFFAWTPKQDGVNNNFTNYGTLRLNLNKISSSPVVLMMKLEFNGTSQTFEQQISLPQGSNQWQEVSFDFSQVSASLLASVKNILFFVDPASETTTGSFYMDRMRLAERPNEQLLDDFEGNSSLIQTYWDGDGSGTVFTRTVDSTQGFDGTHSMIINYNKSAQFPTSFFALTPKQDGITNDFSRYNILKLMVKKDTVPAMRLMMKFDLEGTQINFESWKEIPAGQTGWIELSYDFSSLNPSTLKQVRNILFFVDPMFYTTPQASQGSFHMDSIKLGFQSDLPAKQFDPTRPPQIGWVSSTVAADLDNEYHVGSLVRINAWELNAAGDLLDGTVRIVSKSTSYDSGEQRLIFTHDGQFWPFHWDTTGLKVADDYAVIVTLKDKSGNVTVLGTETTPALTIHLTKGVPAGGELLQIQDFSLPLSGGSLPIARSYDPVDAEIFDHQLGLGWHSSLDYFVQDFPDGTASVSMGAGGYQFYFKNPDGSYRSMAPNDYSVLTKISGGFQIKLKDGTVYQFTSSPFIDLNTNSTTWFVTKMTDTNANQTQFFYDENRNLTKVVAPSGDSVQLQYSFRNRDQFNTNKYNLDKLIDQAGNIWTLVHDSKGNLISVSDPLNQKTIYEYDSKSKLAKIIYPDASAQSYTYDSESRVFQVLRNGIVQSESTYGDRNNSTFSVKDALGRVSSYTLSDEGLLLESTNPLGNKTQNTYDSKRNLIKQIDPLGNTYVYTYDTKGNLLTSTDPLGKVTTYTYEPNFNKAATVKDALGNTTSFSYDAKGNLIKATDPALNAAQNTYDVSGNLIQTKDPLGNLTNFTYNLNGLPLTQTNALGNVSTNQYDAKGNVIKTIDALGNITLFEYDILGRLLSQTDPLGRKITFSYDSMGRAVQRKDALGNIETNQYDSNGRIISVTNALGNKVLFAYDAKGNQISQTDPLGNVTTFTYDSLDRVIQIKDPLGRIASVVYDSLGRKTSQTDSLGNKVQFQYDVLGRLTKTTYPNVATQSATYDALGRTLTETDTFGKITRFTYDSRGNLLTQTDPLGAITTFTYNANNQRISVKDALNNITGFQYDALGRLIKTTYADGNFETKTYDALNRVTKVTDAINRSATSAYDAVGNLIQITDPAGNSLQTQYDALNRKIKDIDALGNMTTYTYDTLSRLTKITDAKGNISLMSYDVLGRLLDRTYPDGSKESFIYDAVGNITQSKDRMNRLAQATYDAGNRVTKNTLPDGSQETFVYDVMGNVTSVANSSGTIANTYDLLGRLTKQVDVFGNIMDYTYDAKGRRLTTKATIGTSILNQTYTYDLLGRLTQIVDEKGQKTTYTYDSRSRILEKALPNGAKTQYSYDGASELTQILYKDSTGVTFRTLSQAFDSRGLVASKTDSSEGVSSFNYDKLGQLVSMTHPVIGLVTFALDQLGNRTQVNTGATPENYATNTLNEYTTAGTESFQYDLDGNMLERLDSSTSLKTQYQYNVKNQLTKVTMPDGTTVTFAYDVLGRRISKTVGSITTRFLWDGSELLAELDGTGKLLKSYVHGPEVDEVLYQTDYIKNETLFFHLDNLQSAVALTDVTGQVKESYTYDPYGNLTSSKDKLGNNVPLPSTRILYTGREFDFETGLYFNRARYYDPSLGRFINADPKGYAAGLNLYTYVQNNPLSFRDPSGLDVYWGGGRNYYKIINGQKMVMANGVWNCVGNCGGGGESGGGKKGGKCRGLLGVLGIVAAVVAVAIAAPFIGAIAGAIGGAIGGAVGAVAGAVAGSAVGAAVGTAVGAVAGAAALAAGAAVVATATSNLVQGAPVFRGVGTNAAFAAITAGAFKAVSVIGSGFQQGFQSIASIIDNTGRTFGSGLTQVGDKFQQSVRNNFFRPENAIPVLGSESTFLPPGRGLALLIEDYVPAAHNFAVLHDTLVGAIAPDTRVLHPANIPTMPPAYVAGVIYSGFGFAQDILEGIYGVVNR